MAAMADMGGSHGRHGRQPAVVARARPIGRRLERIIMANLLVRQCILVASSHANAWLGVVRHPCRRGLSIGAGIVSDGTHAPRDTRTTGDAPCSKGHTVKLQKTTANPGFAVCRIRQSAHGNQTSAKSVFAVCYISGTRQRVCHVTFSTYGKIK